MENDLFESFLRRNVIASENTNHKRSALLNPTAPSRFWPGHLSFGMCLRMLCAMFFIVMAGTSALAGNFCYTLRGPDVIKLDWNTRGLTFADINGDGLNDLLVINNATAKIDLLYQADASHPVPDMERIVRKNRWEPVLSDARFYNDPLVTGQTCFALAAGDLNCDGRVDIAYTGDIMPLTVCFQGKDGTFSTRWTFDHLDPLKIISSIAVTDLDGDGKNELVVMASLRIFIFENAGQKSLKVVKKLRLSATRNSYLEIFDYDGDGRPDLSYFMNGDFSHLIVRFQRGRKDFGPETIIDLKEDVSSLTRFSSAGHERSFACVLPQTGMIRTFVLKKKVPERSPGISMRIFSADIGGNSKAVYACGDFNADGLEDIAVADPAGARILIYLRKPDDSGFFRAKSYPSLASIDCLAPIHNPYGRPDALMVLSNNEGIAGASEFDPSGEMRLKFPLPFHTKGKPVVGAAIDVGEKSGDCVVLFEKKGEDDYFFEWLAADREHFGDSLFGLKVSGIHREPENIFVMDLDQDGLEDILLLIPREPARVFRQTRRGRFSEIAADSAIRKGMLNNLRLNRIGIADVNGDGKKDLLVSYNGFVRAFRIGKKNEFIVLDQYNSADPGSALFAPVILDIDGDAENELVVYADALSSLEVFKRDSEGIFRSYRFISIPHMDLIAGRPMPGRHVPELVCFGADRFLQIQFCRKVWMAEDIAPSYETNLKDVAYTNIAAGNFHQGSGVDFVAIDGRKHVLDLLSFKESEGCVSRFFFTIFDENGSYGQERKSGVPEPREILTGDFSGDGLDDIVFLIHDRVLIYTQKAEKTGGGIK